MATVPLPGRLGPADPRRAQAIRDRLLFDHGIEVAVVARSDALWARLSFQVYNDDSDVDRFAEAVDALETQ